MQTEYASVSGESAEAVLCELGEYAVAHGYAQEGYVQAVLEREAAFPTGLQLPGEGVGVAIPHADPDHVRRDGVVLGLPEEPVAFASMDDPDRSVDAGAVLLLLATGSDGYTAFLSNLTTLFQEDAFGAAVRERDADTVLDLVRTHCL